MGTRRWTRSPRGTIFGVATGLAEWKDLDPRMTRIIVFLIVLLTGLFPGIAIYLLLAIILPQQTADDEVDGDEPIDVSFEEADDEESLRQEYEDLRRRMKDVEERLNRKERSGS